MKHIPTTILSLALALLFASCSEQVSDPVSSNVPGDDSQVHKRPIGFVAQLSGANTSARGQAVFNVAPDGQSISYRLIATGIDEVTMAHIHMAPLGLNGPVVVWLYPSAPPPASPSGLINGLFAAGTITASNLTGPLNGDPLSDLITAMSAGNTYVNVHTVPYPAGEIRGQIK